MLLPGGAVGGRDFKTRVLVVDDEPVILETMAAILEGEGFVVRTAEDGFAALVTLRQTLPDIIISDLRMPNMSGSNSCRWFAEGSRTFQSLLSVESTSHQEFHPGGWRMCFFKKAAIRLSSFSRP